MPVATFYIPFFFVCYALSNDILNGGHPRIHIFDKPIIDELTNLKQSTDQKMFMLFDWLIYIYIYIVWHMIGQSKTNQKLAIVTKLYI
jgi:hypothetical protein